MGGWNKIEYHKGDIIGDNGCIFIEEIEPYIQPNGNVVRQALFKCPLCGKIFKNKIYNIKSNNTKSCGCLKLSKYNLNKEQKMKDKKFGKLTIIKDTGKRSYNRTIIWLCQCDCGNYIEVPTNHLNSGHTQSCGCINSKGELKISQLLRENKILFHQQYIFEDCLNLKTNKPLKFDFYLPDYNCCIEYDGEQHFNARKQGYFTEDKVKEIQQRDKIKNEYCKNKNIKLIRIPYTDYQKITQKYIKELLFNDTL